MGCTFIVKKVRFNVDHCNYIENFSDNDQLISTMENVVCNSCFQSIKNILFHFTQCGHIFCDDCVIAARAQCPQCNSTNVVTIASNDRENFQKVSYYFESIMSLQDKLSAVISFQETQKQIAMDKFKRGENKYQAMKDAFWKNVANLKQLQTKYTKLKLAFIAERKRIEQLKMSIQSRQQRPLMGNSQKLIDNNLSHDMINMEQFTSHLQNNYSQFTPPTTDKKVVFKVPNITKAPKSASRHSSGGSRSSNTTISTPDFHHRHFSDSDDSDETMVNFNPKLY